MWKLGTQWKPGTVLNDPKNHGDRFLIPIMTQGVILKDKLLKSIMYLIILVSDKKLKWVDHGVGSNDHFSR